jgi:selenocysteine lyase/cysteine desulfurase
MTPGGFHAFEHRWAVAEAFRFHLAIRKPRVAARIHELNQSCKDGLARMSHVKLHTPRASRISSGIICFEVARGTLAEAKGRLRAQGIIASLSPYDPSYLRLAPSLITSERDVDRALAGVRLLA